MTEGRSLSRRSFVGTASSLAIPVMVPGLVRAGARDTDPRRVVPARSSQAQRILILGGTGFIGPHMVRAAQAEGHEVTLFNRGRTNPGMFADVEELRGDRGGDLAALRGRTWDVVIDNSGYYPEHVEASARLLSDQAEHYIFTSTTDVYRDYDTPGMTEDYPLGVLPEGEPHNPSRWYGQLKVICERTVRSAFPDRNTVIRPTWICGPGDNNHLWTYWVERIHRGGEVLAPGRPEWPIQWVDGREVGAFVIKRANAKDGGTFHLVAPPMRMDEMLYGIRATTSADVSFTWVHEDFLWDHGVQPWVNFPLWWPARNDYGEPVFGGIKGGEGSALLVGDHAWSHGLEYGPLAELALATHVWYNETFDSWPEEQRPGVPAAQERQILDAWAAR